MPNIPPDGDHLRTVVVIDCVECSDPGPLLQLADGLGRPLLVVLVRPPPQLLVPATGFTPVLVLAETIDSTAERAALLHDEVESLIDGEEVISFTGSIEDCIRSLQKDGDLFVIRHPRTGWLDRILRRGCGRLIHSSKVPVLVVP